MQPAFSSTANLIVTYSVKRRSGQTEKTKIAESKKVISSAGIIQVCSRQSR